MKIDENWVTDKYIILLPHGAHCKWKFNIFTNITQQCNLTYLMKIEWETNIFYFYFCGSVPPSNYPPHQLVSFPGTNICIFVFLYLLRFHKKCKYTVHVGVRIQSNSDFLAVSKSSIKVDAAPWFSQPCRIMWSLMLQLRKEMPWELQMAFDGASIWRLNSNGNFEGWTERNNFPF